MPELSFDTGLVTYNLNGKCEISFNPCDAVFVERIHAAIEAIDKINNAYTKNAETMELNKEVFELSRKRDSEISKIIDDLFSAPVCESVFDGMSICAYADGFPVWLNLLLAITDEIDKNTGEIKKKADPRIEKYTAKYKKYNQYKK